MKDWQVQSTEYIAADRFWKVCVIKNNAVRTVYFPYEVKIGEFVAIKER